MNVLRSRVTHALVALACGAGATLVTVAELGDAESWAPPPPGDRVSTAIAALEQDPVHVPPDGRAMLDEAGEAALETLITERDLPVRVVVWQSSTKAGYDHPSLSPAEQIVENLDEPVVLVLWQGPEDSRTETPESWTTRYPGYEEEWEPEPTFLGDPAISLREWLAAVPPDLLAEQSDSDYYGGPGGGIAFALLVGIPGVAVFWALAGLVRLASDRGFLPRAAAPRRGSGGSARRPVEMRKQRDATRGRPHRNRRR